MSSTLLFWPIAFGTLAVSRSRFLAASRRSMMSSSKYCFSAESVRRCEPEIVLEAKVVKGFGRGGKLLGCPTANLDEKELGSVLDDLETGVYFGWAKLGNSDQVYKMVASIGWNPTFKNEKKTVEPHIMHEFSEDFYGERLKIVVCGYIRPELAFESMEALISWIQDDIAISHQVLDSGNYDDLKAKCN